MEEKLENDIANFRSWKSPVGLQDVPYSYLKRIFPAWYELSVKELGESKEKESDFPH